MNRLQHAFALIWARLTSETPPFFAVIVKAAARATVALFVARGSIVMLEVPIAYTILSVIDNTLVACTFIAFTAQLTTNDKNIKDEPL